MKKNKLKKRQKPELRSVQKYACSCNCWCLFPFTVNENMTNALNGAR